MAHVEADLLAYLDGELSPAAAGSVEAHLAQCPSCQSMLEELAALEAGLTRVVPAAYDAVHLAPAAEQRIRTSLAAERERQARGGATARVQDLPALIWAALRPLSKAAIPLTAVLFFVLTLNVARMPVQPAAQQMLVLGQDTFAPGTDAAVRVLLRDTADGQPIANAGVNVRLRQAGLAKTVYTGSTDQTGSAPVRFAVPADWEGPAELVVEAESALGRDEVSSPIRLARTYRLLLSSDKPVYQPGETLHLRALALGTVDGLPAAGQVVRFEVVDPNGTPLLKQEVPASDFGIAAVDLPLPADAAQGQYQLYATLGDTASQLSVDVSQAPLPAFEVAVQADAPYYLSGQPLTGAVDAAYFFGKPVANAAVVLRALVTGPGADPAGERLMVQEVQGQTDAAGHFAFQLPLPELPAEAFAAAGAASGKPEGTLALDLEATVTDAAGEPEFGWQKLALARQPILVDVVAEGGTLRTGVENILYVLTSYPDGTPVASTVQVRIGGGLPIEEVTSPAGIAEVRFTPRAGDAGSREVQVTATDAAGREGTAELELPLDEAKEALLLRTDRAIYQVGDTMALEALATGAGDAVYLDVVKAGQLMLARSEPIVDGKATFALDLTPELAGTLELNAYLVAADGNVLRDSRVAIVDAPEEVLVRIVPDRAEYAPGDEASVGVQTTAAGQGLETAVGLSVVNEAVYARREYQPGFARAYFLVDDALREAGVDPAATTSAQQQMARASWAGYQGQPYTLGAQATDADTQDAVNAARAARFEGLSLALSLALLLAALLVAGVVLAGLRRSGVLGRAAGRLALSLLLLGVLSVIALAVAEGLLGLWGEQASTIVLVVSGLLWLAALAALAVYAWRSRDQRAQYVALLAFLYAACLVLLAYAGSQGVELSTLWLALLALSFGIWLAALLLFGWGLRLEGERRAGAIVLVLALLVVPLVAGLSTASFGGAGLLRDIAGPSVYGFPASLMAGCAAPASAPAPEMAAPAADQATGLAEAPAEQRLAEEEQRQAAAPAEAPAEAPMAAEVAPAAVEEAAPAVEAPVEAAVAEEAALAVESAAISETLALTTTEPATETVLVEGLAVVTPTLELAAPLTETVALTAAQMIMPEIVLSAGEPVSPALALTQEVSPALPAAPELPALKLQVTATPEPVEDAGAGEPAAETAEAGVAGEAAAPRLAGAETATAVPRARATATPEEEPTVLAAAAAATAAAPAATRVPELAAAPTLSPEATATPLPEPTATPLPEPTATPVPEPTPEAAAAALAGQAPTEAPLPFFAVPEPTVTPQPTLPPPVLGLEAFGLGGGGDAQVGATPVALEALPIVRERFPQTLYWDPEIVTDGNGRLQVTIPVGDSITTWRVNALAVGRGGQLGSASVPLRVFKPLFIQLNLPATMALNAEIYTGVQLFNYSPQPLTVSLYAEPSAGLSVQLSSGLVTVPANEAMVVPMRVRATAAGEQTLAVIAQGDTVQDARQARVVVR